MVSGSERSRCRPHFLEHFERSRKWGLAPSLRGASPHFRLRGGCRCGENGDTGPRTVRSQSPSPGQVRRSIHFPRKTVSTPSEAGHAGSFRAFSVPALVPDIRPAWNLPPRSALRMPTIIQASGDRPPALPSNASRQRQARDRQVLQPAQITDPLLDARPIGFVRELAQIPRTIRFSLHDGSIGFVRELAQFPRTVDLSLGRGSIGLL